MIVKIHTVFCEGDHYACHGWIGEERTTGEARKVARDGGWKRVDGRDLCPSCAEKEGVA